jgi:glutamate racemase
MTKIGVFDSGVGGLSVLTEIRRVLPESDLTYLADRANAPYGQRSLQEVRKLAETCTDHLLGMGMELIVVACNTASAAALHYLRALHTEVPFIGIEPALKPAVALTRNKVIGILATNATFQGELFASLVGRFADGVTLINQACPGWAQLVEAGVVTGNGAESTIARYLDPVLRAGADTLVLGCTHYPFLRHLIAARGGSHIAIVDPSAAVARRVAEVSSKLRGDKGSGQLRLLTNDDPDETETLVRNLTGIHESVTALTLAKE